MFPERKAEDRKIRTGVCGDESFKRSGKENRRGQKKSYRNGKPHDRGSKMQKDEALKAYNLQFDGCTRETLQVSREEIQKAYSQLTGQEIEDLKKAAGNIRHLPKHREKR